MKYICKRKKFWKVQNQRNQQIYFTIKRNQQICLCPMMNLKEISKFADVLWWAPKKSANLLMSSDGPQRNQQICPSLFASYPNTRCDYRVTGLLTTPAMFVQVSVNSQMKMIKSQRNQLNCTSNQKINYFK